MSGTRIYPEWEFGDVLKSSDRWDGGERDEVRMMYVGPRHNGMGMSVAFWGLVLVNPSDALRVYAGDTFYRAQSTFWELDPEWP